MSEILPESERRDTSGSYPGIMILASDERSIMGAVDEAQGNPVEKSPGGYSYRDLAEQGRPLPEEDSFRGGEHNENRSPEGETERQALKDQEVAYARFMVHRASTQDTSAERRRPTELRNERYAQKPVVERIVDKVSGIEYSVARFNVDELGRPLVLVLGLSSTVNRGAGEDISREFAAHIRRPIIVIDNESTGDTSIPDDTWLKGATVSSISQSRLRILDRMGVDDFDVAGYSFGGMVAAGVAAEAGDRVHSLVTIETPGFEDNNLRTAWHNAKDIARDKKTYKRGVAPEVIAREEETTGGSQKQSPLTARNFKTMYRMSVLMNSDQTTTAIPTLAPDTHWSDIVGSEDKVAGWRSHLSTVRARDREFARPAVYQGELAQEGDVRIQRDLAHNTDVLVVGGGGHHNMKAERAAMAEMVATALDRQEKREEAKREALAEMLEED